MLALHIEMTPIRHLTAIGDCNTLGANLLEGNSYPERIASRIGVEVTNLGHTMATTREGLRLLDDVLGETDCLLIQFGLADSYTTFRYSPYVLYYPDTILRRPLRSLVKKFKKTCRRSGLSTLLGEKNVVSLEEYEINIRQMIEMSEAKNIFLLETIPHKEVTRNSNIHKYNGVLETIAQDYDVCFKIDLYDIFASELDHYYQDSTHCSDAGYDCIADIVCRKIADLHYWEPIKNEL
jgi:lysophospholipase L1-like esterase